MLSIYYILTSPAIGNDLLAIMGICGNGTSIEGTRLIRLRLSIAVQRCAYQQTVKEREMKEISIQQTKIYIRYASYMAYLLILLWLLAFCESKSIRRRSYDWPKLSHRVLLAWNPQTVVCGGNNFKCCSNNGAICAAVVSPHSPHLLHLTRFSVFIQVSPQKS